MIGVKSSSTFSCRGVHSLNIWPCHSNKYRLYNENEGLSNIHAEGEARGRVYLMNPSSNCITGLYQSATNEIHLTKMVGILN